MANLIRRNGRWLISGLADSSPGKADEHRPSRAVGRMHAAEFVFVGLD